MFYHNFIRFSLITLTFVAWTQILSRKHRVEACTCLAPEQPAYCNTDFFLLAQILSKNENQDKGTVRYRFKPLQTITDPKGVISTRKAKQFHTSSASSACGVELKVGSRYLIGGIIHPTNQKLMLDLCRAYIELYDQANWQKAQFKELMQNCNVIDQTEK